MMKKKEGKKTISKAFLKWLLVIVIVGFAVSMLFSWTMQTRMSQRSAANLLRLNIRDLRQDIIDASDRNLLGLTEQIANDLNTLPDAVDAERLELLTRVYNVSEINVIDAGGIIVATTHPDFLNYDMRSGAQSAEFLCLLDGSRDSYVQSCQPTSYDPDLLRKYAGVCLDAGGFVEVGYDALRFQQDIDEEVVGASRNRHVGENGGMIIADVNWNIVSDREHNEGENLSATGIWIDRDTLREGEVFRTEVYGENCSCMYQLAEGYYIVAFMPENEILLSRDTSVRLTAILEVLVFLTLFAVIFWLVRRIVINNIRRVNKSLSKITDGDLEEVVDVRENMEFSSLSDDINATVDTLKQYISEAAARIDAELAVAKNIQKSALPTVFPPYPERKEFSLYATMDAAREVGGDFYDFYLLDEKKLAFLVSDVSGKGIPAAMFMMTGKSVLRNYAERGDSPADVFRNANDKLCEGNDAEMFITSWMGFLDTDTGLVRFGNAGHNPPVLVRNGSASFIPQRANLTLAAMEGVRYREQSLQLEPGDLLFLYTDGVTEATDAQEQLFGNERLLAVLSASFGSGEDACKAACARVKQAVDDFVGEAPQFDDITMLCLFYAGPAADGGAETLTVPAERDRLAEVLGFVDERLEAADCSMKAQMQIDVAIEEIFVNIASYAYGPDGGEAKLSMEVRDGVAEFVFRDRGVAFDPLAKPDPDVTLSAEDRKIGGLGIFMVKKSMDEIYYRRENGENVLTMRKKL